MKRIVTCAVLTLLIVFAAMDVMAAGKQEPGAQSDGPETKPSAHSESFSFTDGADRTITIDKQVTRIICGSSDAAEVIKILDAGDLVVGVDMFLEKEKTLFPVMGKLPSVGTHASLDLEKIIELDADILIVNTSVSWFPEFEDIVKALEPDMKVICLNFIDQNAFIGDFKILQKITGKETEGNKYLDFYTGILSEIKETVSTVPVAERPRVYWEMYGAWQTFGKTLDMYQIQLENAGGINIGSDLEGMMVEVDKEWLIEANPDVIVKVAYPEAGYPGVPQTPCGYLVNDTSGMEDLVASIKQRAALLGTNAVVNDRVFVRHYELMETPRNIIGVAYLAKWFYPELLSDLDPKQLHQRYLHEFLHVDYDLSKNGAFAWPE
jgi:iron complex transport system substrate-binding protein